MNHPKEIEKVRLDKWLWSVRLYKTRSQATTACDQGKVSINDQAAKASRLVRVGDIISIKRTGIMRNYKVLNLISNRVGPKLVIENCQDLTPPEQLEAYKNRTRGAFIYREPGTGRPTKRDRRDLEDFFDEV